MTLRKELVKLALEWEKKFGVAPSVTGIVGEYDAAEWLGMSKKQYSDCMKDATAVRKGYDFEYEGKRYQVKACRPSGKKGSEITKVPNVRNYEWDYYIWVRYNKKYDVLEMWQFSRKEFKKRFPAEARIRPEDIMRHGKQLFPKKRLNKPNNRSSK